MPMSRLYPPPLDDVTALRQHLRMPHLRYLDISAANALDQAVRRWPLLAESESIRPLESALRSPSDDQKPIAQERLA